MQKCNANVQQQKVTYVDRLLREIFRVMISVDG